MGRATSCFLSALFLLAAGAVEAAPLRRATPLADGWRFLRADAPGAEAGALDDRRWALVKVPHTWNALDGQDGGDDYYRGVAWYRRRVPIPAAEKGRSIYFEVDGANTVTTLFVDGKEIGRHAGGFARFRFDVTAAVTPGKPSLFALRVSIAADPAIPPRTADFTSFGGLYREVRLVSVDPVHLDLDTAGDSGVLAFQRAVTKKSAAADVRVAVTNASDEAREVEVVVTARAAKSVAASGAARVTLPARGRGQTTVPLKIESPHLWDGVRDPFLHSLEVQVSTGGKVVDVVTEPLGLRSFDFDAQAGFSLNGTPLNLHGVNRHQDREGKGWALSRRDHEEDLALIRELGANAVRLAHYQHSQSFYDLCDRYGLIVWAEIPVVNNAASGAFAKNAEQQLVELIRQSGNHPSIVTWSVANELQHDKSEPGAIVPLVKALAAAARREDPTRPTSLATFYGATDPSVGLTDLVGFNRYDGWYVNTLSAFAPGLDVMRARRPQLRMAVSEYGAGASVAIHAAEPKKMDHSEEYQALFHEAYWRAISARPFIWGSFVWNMFDFAVDVRKEGDHAGRNDKGLVTYDRKTKKDAFYWFKANWSEAPAFVHVTGRRFTPRPAGAYELKVYSNAPAVRLTVNGLALSEVTAADHLFTWPGVALRAGRNVVEASATVGARVVRDRVTIVGE
jgi:beta-galactosidase